MTHEQIEYRNYMMQAMAAMWHSTMQFMSVGYSWKSNHKIFRQQKRADTTALTQICSYSMVNTLIIPLIGAERVG